MASYTTLNAEDFKHARKQALKMCEMNLETATWRLRELMENYSIDKLNKIVNDLVDALKDLAAADAYASCQYRAERDPNGDNDNYSYDR